jgi:hypothetical protein
MTDASDQTSTNKITLEFVALGSQILIPVTDLKPAVDPQKRKVLLSMRLADMVNKMVDYSGGNDTVFGERGIAGLRMAFELVDYRRGPEGDTVEVVLKKPAPSENLSQFSFWAKDLSEIAIKVEGGGNPDLEPTYSEVRDIAHFHFSVIPNMPRPEPERAKNNMGQILQFPSPPPHSG